MISAVTGFGLRNGDPFGLLAIMHYITGLLFVGGCVLHVYYLRRLLFSKPRPGSPLRRNLRVDAIMGLVTGLCTLSGLMAIGTPSDAGMGHLHGWTGFLVILTVLMHLLLHRSRFHTCRGNADISRM